MSESERDSSESRESSEDGFREPVYKRDLLEDAKDAEEPVTEVEVSDSGRTTRVHAIQECDGVAYRAQITVDEKGESPPSIQFGRTYWDSDAKVMREWLSLATGRLSGPQNLPAWESLFTVFNAALGAFNREVRSDG
jgi:hypothetical protein